MNNYIIINADAIQKRIEELEKVEEQQVGNLNGYISIGGIRELKQVVSQSTPLIPEIGKAFNAGSSWGFADGSDISEFVNHPNMQEYIENLKLDI